jgi:hypothetical protein
MPPGLAGIDMSTPIKSFVVRIYRVQGGNGRRVIGVVQAPRVAASRAFTSVAQLWEILSERTPALRKKDPAAHAPNDQTAGNSSPS